ncbi:sigma-70 family RNA polymerase sigma factor [Brevibacillus humidisoli]|uniref:sigma-70 family RNA polymerase sigma factor n=1 Tax=Brevibacillus humidisoli TaxID=2895522 RepID=UPI001E4C97A4|nr:sigma-70 family RNA polymerase sigma factor [Brevibacillus humidisoli]
MREYGTRVLRLVYLFVKDRSIAEDITQDVFVKVYRHLPEFRHESSIHTWIYRIAVNECKGYLRSWDFRKIVPTSKIQQESGTTVEAEALGNLDRADVTRVVMSLPYRHRQVIVLYYYSELSIAEVSAVLGLSEGTIRTRLHRARQKVKELLIEEGLGWT